MTKYYRIEAWRAWFYLGIADLTVFTVLSLVALSYNEVTGILYIPGTIAFLLAGIKSLHNGWTVYAKKENPVGEY